MSTQAKALLKRLDALERKVAAHRLSRDEEIAFDDLKGFDGALDWESFLASTSASAEAAHTAYDAWWYVASAVGESRLECPPWRVSQLEGKQL